VAHIDEYSDYTLSGGFPFGATNGIGIAKEKRRLAQEAETDHLSLFASAATLNDAKRAFPGAYTQLITRVLVPTENAKLTGDQLLTAMVDSEFRITKVEYRLTGTGLRNELIGVGTSESTRFGNTTSGYRALWNTADVPNGRYDLRSVVYDASGKVTYSNATAVTVAN
jgi:hypothetical protein